MGGSTYTVPSPGVIDLRIFDLLIKPIREEDRLRGDDFVWRFLLGPQQVWEQTQANIEDLKSLLSVTDCPDELLQHLKWTLGWTSELDHITDGLDYDTLRRLIAASVPLWKNRSTESSIISVLNLLVPGRARVWNWFDVRWMLDETILSEEHQGRDPYLVHDPDSLDGPWWSNVRIVNEDPTDSLRQLVKDVINLMRPSGERFEIIYLNFLDLFEIDDDWTQWSVAAGSDPTVEDGLLKLTDDSVDENLEAVKGDVYNWSEYLIFARIKGHGSAPNSGFGVSFYQDDIADNLYFVTLTVYDNKINLGSVVGGVFAGFVSQIDMGTFWVTLQEDIWYGLRIQVTDEGANNRIKVYLDGMEVINTTDSDHSQGTIGVIHNTGITCECDEIEAMGLPAVLDTVEINY